jgi:hypothetical protein
LTLEKELEASLRDTEPDSENNPKALTLAWGSHIRKEFGKENKEGVGSGRMDQDRKATGMQVDDDAEMVQKHFHCHGRMAAFVAR